MIENDCSNSWLVDMQWQADTGYLIIHHRNTTMKHANNFPLRHTGKIAFVTGGSRGIGAAIVRRLAGEGATVAFTYQRSADEAQALVQAVEAAGGKALALQAD